MLRKLRWAGLAMLALVSPACAAQANSPLWADLQPGRFQVGFKHIYVFDSSRGWTKTRDHSGKYSPDRNGRPLRISVWFPAEGGRRMTFGDYIGGNPPPAFKAYDALVSQQDRFHSRLNVPKGRLADLLGTPVNAFKDAQSLADKFPLVIYCDGLNGDTVSNIVLAEYLASHGFVVATVPVTGTGLATPVQKPDQSGLETTVRDLEFAWGVLRNDPGVDQARVAVMGHSMGGVEALLFAMRNGNVSAVVGLDGTYGFAEAKNTLTGFYGYDPARMAAPLLDLRRAEKDSGPSAFKMDLAAIQRFYYSPRSFVTLTGMYHTDFTDFGILAKLFGFPPFADRNYKTGSLGYQSVCRIVLDYLENVLKQDGGARVRLAKDVAAAPGGQMRFAKAIPLPPTPEEMIAIASKQGLDAAKAIIGRYRRDASGDVIVNEADYDALGYALLEQHRLREAVLALAIDTYVYPGSANLADSLGDMYAGAGEKDKALAAYRHGLDLLPNDAEQSADGKKEMKTTLLQAIAKVGGGTK
jgi:dienelactone hydrolase